MSLCPYIKHISMNCEVPMKPRLTEYEDCIVKALK
jgi:hypothetical protein